MIIEAECRICGKTKSLNVDYDRVQKWMNGMLIQDAFPEMPVEDRELLISGTCPECWDKLFNGGGFK